MTDKMRSMRFTARGWVVLFAIVFVAPAYALSADAAPATVVNYYETPCETQTRETFEVPPLTLDQSKGLIAWQRAHANTPAGEAFNAALRQCMPVPNFDFDNMVLIKTEVVP